MANLNTLPTSEINSPNCSPTFEVWFDVVRDNCKEFHFSKPSEGYSFLFKAFHKAFKADSIYLDFADWWDFRNFRNEDHKKEIIPNLKDPIMSIAEQGFIAYSKHLVPKQLFQQDRVLDKNKVLQFIILLDDVIESHPEHQYLPYFKGKLLLALGDTENILSAVLPFARKKRNDFWVWEVLSEAFPDDEKKKITCFCKALSCKAADEFLINLRQKMVTWFIDNNMFDEAKTEIEFIIKAREANEWKIPPQINNWLSQTWYTSATSKTSNIDYYRKYLPIADNILYQDVPQETVIVDFVNTNKKILNFIASESKFGFFKYDRYLKDVQIGDILNVRFQGGSNQGAYQAYTVSKINDEVFRKQFLKEVEGKLNVPAGKPFGFLDDVFVHPTVVLRNNLADGMHLKGQAIKSYNQDKKQWGWKFISK